ncbi:hypothetical protein FGB62_342g04 [Gracilaria domingensis]|nr:hypothetical protein FGB62_342g04 [Gracilaria domingensis]
MDARHSNNEATAESVNAHELVSEVQGDAVSIIDELNTIDEVRDQMTLEEEEEIYGNARTVQDSVKNCTRKALDVNIEAGKAFERNLNIAEMAGVPGKEAASRPHPSKAKAFSLAALRVEELCSQNRRQSMSILTHGGLVKTVAPTARRMPLVTTMCPKSSKSGERNEFTKSAMQSGVKMISGAVLAEGYARVFACVPILLRADVADNTFNLGLQEVSEKQPHVYVAVGITRRSGSEKGFGYYHYHLSVELAEGDILVELALVTDAPCCSGHLVDHWAAHQAKAGRSHRRYVT